MSMSAVFFHTLNKKNILAFHLKFFIEPHTNSTTDFDTHWAGFQIQNDFIEPHKELNKLHVIVGEKCQSKKLNNCEIH